MSFYYRRTLQGAVAVFGFIPVLAGMTGVIYGVSALGFPGGQEIALDSHVRYLSGLLLAIGLGFWSTIPDVEAKGARFGLLTGLVFVGGLARLYGYLISGFPGWSMSGGLVMELIVTPCLFLMQRRVAKARPRPFPP